MNVPLVTWAVARSGGVILGRILNYQRLPITQASITSLAYVATDLVTKLNINRGSITVAGVIYDTLQTAPIWVLDSLGYNFLWPTPAQILSGPGNRAQIDILVTPLTGEVFRLPPVILNLQRVYT
jgi:hypothetical protein